jgi:NAD(P)H-hydrate epimerase
MLRLLGADRSSGLGDDRSLLEREAVALAAGIDAVILLKGPATLVADRTRQTHNATGNPGMATAGTGDVLTGVIAALVAQRLPPFDAARLAAWVHGRAGDVATAEFGRVSMTASDLLSRLHVAFREVTGELPPG